MPQPPLLTRRGICWRYRAMCCAHYFSLAKKTCFVFLSVFWVAPLLSAQDGAALYTLLCSSCHDGGTAPVPNRDALRAMSPEGVLESLEAGSMVSMASGRSTSERRAVAQF